MSTLTLFEHETVPQELSAHQLTLLAQLQQRLGEKVLQPVYRGGAWYLREYFYNDGERLRAILGSAFVGAAPPQANLFEQDVDLADPDRSEIVINTFPGDDAGFIAALQKIAGGATDAP